ncbi:MAG: BadF/BadG/BcrA/BcrD ATPase family protein [Caldilinea sp.]
MTRFFLGIDGGGTKTQVAICDEGGCVLGAGLGGASGIDSVGADAATVSIGAAVAAARAQAGLPDAPFASVFFGMAGVVSESDRDIVRDVAQRLQLGDAIHVDHDIRISLAGGLSGRPGIALIAGTGSSCFGMNAAGERWQSGGWGHIISDEGSSYWFGSNAIRLAMGAFDGRWQTALLEPVRERLELASMLDIHYRLYTQGVSKTEIAGFAPLVMEASVAGDKMAQQLIRQGVQDLAQMVAAVARRLGWQDASCEVTLTGGLWRAGEPVLAPFRAALAEMLPQARIVMPELPPVLGACVLALQAGDVSVDAAVRECLSAQKELL